MNPTRKTEEEQRAFFEAANERAQRAIESTGEVRRTYGIGGKRLRLRFAGEKLVAPLTAALAHLVEPDEGEVHGELCVWDSESSGVSMIDPPCAKRDFTSRGDLWGFDSRRFRAAFHWIESSVNVFDRETAKGAYWIESERLIPYWVKASPFRTLLHWWAELQGWQLIHGAAIGTDDGALLITGKGGVGKSTTALVALTRGLHYLADDYLIASLDPEPAVHSLYATAKCVPEQLARLPTLLPSVTNRSSLGKEKALLALAGRFGERLKRTLPLAALAMPAIERRDDSLFVPADPGTLQRAATFTTLEQLPYAGDHAHAFVNRLVRTLPCYELKLGRDLAALPRVISTLLADKPWTLAKPTADVAGSASPPLVSVIIPVHNGARFLPEAIESILAQGYPAIQIIVVNDGSTDELDAAVGRLPVQVRYIKHDRKKGPSEARNRGIRDAVGDYVAFLDVDDLWPANNLGRLMSVLAREPELDVVHGYGHLMHLNPALGSYEFHGNPKEAFLFYIGAGLYRKRVFETVGLFNPELEFGEDTDWYNRAYELGRPIERLEEVTLHVRRHEQNMTRGKSPIELNMLRVFKLALDRKREREKAGAAANGAAEPEGNPLEG